MNMRKLLSMLLAFVLVLGTVSPCFPVWGAETDHQHTYGQWTFDTAKGTQSRTCSGCSEVQTLHGTTNKAEQVTEPAIGGQYYLAANVDGTLKYFCTPPTGGSVTNTVPYSLYTTESAPNAQRITLEDPTKATEGTSVGFQLTYLNGSTTTRIYCYDVKTDGANRGVMDTGTNTANYKGRHTFEIAEVSGMKVLRKLSNNNILVVKKNTTRNEWRMLGVPASELGTDGVYPVMLVNNHTHSYGTTFEANATHHWKVCDCGAQAEKATHTFGAWSFDTAKGTQSRTCSGCNRVEVLHGTTNKAEQVTAPSIGGQYYLAANVDGTLKYFCTPPTGGSVTNTVPYSLYTTESAPNAQRITLEDPTKANEGTSVGFQLTYLNGSTTTRIYCYDVKTDGANRGVMDTGTNTANYKGRHTFEIAEVSGMKVLRKLSNNNILVVKFNATRNEWRMLGVPASELGTDGVYPVMLVNNHTHTYGTTYEKDETQHWQICDCGYNSAKVDHDFTNGACVCGAEYVPHDCESTDGKWYAEGNKHYQLCGTCNEKINEADHTYSGWTVDTANGTRSKICTACEHVGEVFYGKETLYSHVKTPTVGSTYYMAANVNGTLYSFISGGVTETTPYSLKTSTTLATVTVNKALVAGQGEFQLVDASNRYVYSVADGVGLTTSVNYVTYPEKVSFLMDTVNGVRVIRGYGTNQILAAKYSTAKGAWRIFPVTDSEIGTDGVYPVMLMQLHTHTPATTFSTDENQHWHACTVCDSKLDAANHEYVKTGSDRICECGKVAPLHTCQSANGKWFTEGNKHYQVCGICLERIFVGEHTFGNWVFDTEKGVQTRTCSSCSLGETLHGTGNKVSQVADPVLGKEYYMVANVDGQIHYFRHGTATDTIPYSLWVTDNLNHNWVSKVTVEDPTLAQDQTGEGFQLTYVRPDTDVLTRIYCYDVLKDETVPGQTGVIDTGINTVNYRNRHTFIMDEVGGIKVLRQINNRNILVVKFSDASACYRLVAVPEAELANEGVYPVMLAELHEHDFGSGYQKDETNHWQYCASCDSKLDEESHEYVKNNAGDRVCECGKVMPKHTCKSADGKWFTAAGKHYQVCGTCQEKIKEASHTYGKWTFDTAKGTQTATCKVCSIAETLHGTSDKVYKVAEPAIGESYYLVANVNGTLQYFVLEGSVADTVPYSLHVADKADNENIYQVTTEAPVDGTEGFQLTFVRKSDNTLLRIYCYNAETTNAAMDTGMNTGNELPKHTFKVDTANGVQVLRKLGNNNVLAVRFNETTGTYRIVGVEEAELANEGVYPVMLATKHEHAFDSGYKQDDSKHWKYCADCDSKLEVEKHDYVKNSSGKRVCECGKVMPKHTCKSVDGKWFAVAGKHYQVCGVCQDKIKEASHAYGKWTFDTAKGTQSATCKVCSITETLHGTAGKVYQVAAPAIGDSYYLVANVNGTLQYFVVEGSVADTVPYSLHATDNLSNANIQQVTLETPAAGTEGFQLTYVRASDNTTLRIYCYNAETTNDAMDTGMNTGNELPKHTFKVDTVNGVQVLRKLGNNNVLALKFNEAVGTYRIVGVEEAELANEGVYPVMLAKKHEHAFASGYEQNDRNHWKYCADCDSKLEIENHNYVKNDTGKRVCVCGKVMPKHTCKSVDGKWYAEAGKHYQVCGVCYDKVQEADHTYGKWTFDTAKATQSATCKICKTVDTLHGTNNKVYEVTEPAIGGSYYLVANVNGTLQYFTMEGSVADTMPYSLHATDDLSNQNIKQVTLETPASGTEGFQLTFVRASDNMTLRIYCYNAETTNDALDTGINSGNELPKHTFKLDTVNGVKVLRKLANNSVLVLKFNEETGTYRMLGVDEAELSKAGVYPVMLATQHEHNLGKNYVQDTYQHWHFCASCDSKIGVENHNYVMNETGKRVCECGRVMPKHTCKSADGKWYALAGKHYQVCEICYDRVEEADHAYGKWTFNTEKGTQTATCKVCKTVDTLHGTETKGYQILDPKLGETYYLAANVNGKLHFFRHGTVTDTIPYSLWVTEDVNHEWVMPVTLEDPTVTEEKVATGFQLTYANPTNDVLSRIYCMDVLKDETVAGQTGVMDTGINSGIAYKNRHNFTLKQVDGQTVLSKTGNDNVLVVKYDANLETYRLMGVPASELSNEGVYPAMLMLLHEHTHTDETYLKDELGHWYACSCGGKSNYEDHVVTKWTYIKEPTQTTGGQKTGTCILCGGKAVIDIPPMVAEGHYYLTGKVDGKTYYFRDKTANESVEHTAPFSLMTSSNKKDALNVNVAWDEKANTYVLSYTVTRTLNIYMGDVNGSTVAADGLVDLGASGTTSESMVVFRWDVANKRFYQMERGIRYVIAFEKMTLTDGTKAVRMRAVPESELGGNIVAAKLQLVHKHEYSEKWNSDAVNHWLECSCGARKYEAAHTVPQWKVERKATEEAAGKKSGTCSFCKLDVVNAIPMITDKIKAPDHGDKFYLKGIVDGKEYYFCHTPVGGSVADTYPYSLYTDPGTGFVTPLSVKEKNGIYNLFYGTTGLYLYISGDGVGVTSNTDRKDLVDFLWDEENKVLYQMEGDVKYVLVFMVLRNSSGKDMVRITAMPLDRALIDPTVSIARFTTKAPAGADASALPKDATLLDDAQQQAPGEDAPNDGAVYDNWSGENDQAFMKLVIALAIAAVAVAGIIVLAVLVKNGVIGAVFFRRWNLWAGISFVAAGLVLAAAMILPGIMKPAAPGLETFTIVANEISMEDAEALAVEIYEDHGISLPVVHCDDFNGNNGIFVNVSGFNSYGGYKYRITNQKDDGSAGVYLDGTGPALEVAISKWTKSLKKSPSFPFGITEDVVGYEWNTGDVNMTGLGFELEEMTSRELYEGVELKELKYNSFAYGKSAGYAVIVDADAPVELKVSAGEWDENTNPDNPGEKYTVQQHGKRLTEAGYDVVAITNAGFYDLNTTMTYIPWGMQIVDGLVKKEPNKDNPKNTDNWFAQTADGKYVISNTDGYNETYETKLSDGVGGGLVLMENGKPCFTGTTPDYRTVVGITKDGDLVMLTISGANYAVVIQAFMDMQIDVDCILNLDGGGSTTMHALSEEGKLQQYICETPVEREVADAIAIVKKN